MKHNDQDSWQGGWQRQWLEATLELAAMASEAKWLMTHLQQLLDEMEALEALVRLYKALADDDEPP